ncbi:GEVED domain-containing protein [Flavobacterium terrisoli]|uniref:GEVED domain-containing protein n=1 Tax=Flavobacterium terrisoli TaxID=3242195 RepID=UPI002542FD9E|nr:GEVED domain-containing protein [Flavobacterium buctense]
MENNYKTKSTSFLNPKLIITALLLISGISSLQAQTTSTYATSGTWVCPQGVTSIQVEAWGGGGGGGGAANATNYRGAGGGGGAYQKATSLAVTPGQTYTVTIGSGGTAGTISVNGGAGGNSTFMLGASTLLTANGGGGGQTQTTATAPTGGIGGIGTFNGGNGFTGTITTGGGGGGSAGSTANGVTATSATGGAAGAGGTGTGGNGGGCGSGPGGEGCPGVNYGGAGGGGNKNKIGGAGAGGYIKITFTCPTNTTAAAGPDQSLACATTATLAGNTPTYGTGTWTVQSGTATITSPNSPTSGITGLVAGGSATLRWTISNGVCGSTFDDVVISTPLGVGCWSYCTASATNVYAVSSVSFNTINNAFTGTTGYENFTSISTTLTAGYTYTISVNVIGANGNPAYTSVWFDWNNSGTFDAGEESQLGTYSTGTYAFTTTVTVPLTAVIGSTRMRVINRILTGYAPACGTITYGQIEDYTLNIVSPPACTAPTAQPTALVLSPSGTSLAGSFTAASPAPNNYLVVINTTGTTPTPTNGTTYTVGGAITGGTVVDIDSNTSFVATGLTVSTTYYIFVFSYNSICTGLSQYFTTGPLTGNTTTLATSYCIPTGSLDCTTNGDYIANVTFNTINNSSTCAPGGYINYAATGGQTTTLIRGNTFNLSIGTGPGNKKHGAAVWIDFNQNGVFTDAGEYFLIGNNIIANSTNTIAVAIPAGATLGQTRMRVRYAQKVTVTSAMSCTMTGSFGETEDYTVTIANSVVCSAPTAQPTALILSSTGTTVSGSFTAANPIPNNYLVVMNTTGTTPTPVNTTTYTVGGAITGGTVVDIDSNTSFTATSLTTLTTYYFFVFSYNSICTGGPTYNLVSPLTGNVATITSNYCVPSVTTGREDDNYLTEVSFVGTLNDVSNYSTYSSSPLGYQDFTGLANLSRQAQGYGVNVSVQATFSSFMKAWVDWNKDGTFDNTTEIVYNSGTISTGSTTFGFIIPSAQALGNYRMRIRVDLNGGGGSTTFTSCGNLNNGGETEDYLFTVVANCTAVITGITEGRTCGTGTVDLEATGAVVVPAITQYRWYTTPTGSTLVGTTSTGEWTTPSINTTTNYYVTAYNGCESLTRTEISAIVSPIPNLTYLPAAPVSCRENVGVELSATGDVEEVHLINEEFNSGLGTFTNTNITSSVRNADTQWQNRTSTYIPTAISGTNTWYPAVSSGISGNSFAMATSDFADAFPYVQNQIASSTVSTVNFTSLTLSLRLFYSRYFIDGAYPAEEYVTIDVSTNNGANWIEIKRFTEDVGIGTKFETLSYDLSSYVGVSQFKVRVRYYNNNWCDGIAIDDVELYGNKPNVNLNWTTTIPAFTDAACTIPYDPLTTAAIIYVQPTLAQLEVSSFNFTVNAVLDNGCVTSKVITVTNNTKIWNGTDSNWDDDENWKPLGKPTASSCIVIPDTAIDPIISGTSYDAFGKNITIKSGGNLTVEPANNITITDEVTVKSGALFEIKNSASLIQTNDASVNSGSIKMTRTSRPMTRWAYVYWGSPIVEDAYSQIPSEFDYKFRWQSGTSTGAWQLLSSISQGQGFIARVSDIAPFSTGTGTINFSFIGTPGNGVVSVPVDSFDSSTLTSAGNTVLLANPYPSAVDAASFLTNTGNTELGGTLFFWTSFTTYSGTGNYSTADYGSWNLSGGTAPASDPTNVGLKPNGKIAAGQGFFAQVFADGSVSFNNSMRAADFNTQFFRTANSSTSVSDDNRIWLNLYSDNTFRQMLVNYKAEATNGFDKFYDGPSFTNNEINLYSILDDRNLVIQGRSLPFDENDVVPLGYRVTTGGIYSIAIDELEGLFAEDQNIYLRDKLLSIDYNLKQGAYSFSTESGSFDNRFEIVYVTNALGVNDPGNINTFATIHNNIIKIESSEFIKSVNIYEISGKLINRYNLANASKQLSDSFNYPNGIYIAEITLENGIVVKKKLIH